MGIRADDFEGIMSGGFGVEDFVNNASAAMAELSHSLQIRELLYALCR